MVRLSKYTIYPLKYLFAPCDMFFNSLWRDTKGKCIQANDRWVTLSSMSCIGVICKV